MSNRRISRGKRVSLESLLMGFHLICVAFQMSPFSQYSPQHFLRVLWALVKSSAIGCHLEHILGRCCGTFLFTSSLITAGLNYRLISGQRKPLSIGYSSHNCGIISGDFSMQILVGKTPPKMFRCMPAKPLYNTTLNNTLIAL
jgi:hypothetical protein